MQKQIKITVNDRIEKLIETKAQELGMTKAAYCYNILFEHLRKKELDK